MTKKELIIALQILKCPDDTPVITPVNIHTQEGDYVLYTTLSLPVLHENKIIMRKTTTPVY